MAEKLLLGNGYIGLKLYARAEMIMTVCAISFFRVVGMRRG